MKTTTLLLLPLFLVACGDKGDTGATTEICDDGIDNDGNGAADCADAAPLFDEQLVDAHLGQAAGAGLLIGLAITVAFLASSGARNITGQSYNVDGGIVPA